MSATEHNNNRSSTCRNQLQARDEECEGITKASSFSSTAALMMIFLMSFHSKEKKFWAATKYLLYGCRSSPGSHIITVYHFVIVHHWDNVVIIIHRLWAWVLSIKDISFLQHRQPLLPLLWASRNDQPANHPPWLARKWPNASLKLLQLGEGVEGTCSRGSFLYQIE